MTNGMPKYGIYFLQIRHTTQMDTSHSCAVYNPELIFLQFPEFF